MFFAILRATNLCLRGSRKKWRRVMDINDGAGHPNFVVEAKQRKFKVFGGIYSYKGRGHAPASRP